MSDPWRQAPLWVGGGLLFAILATANAAGYRYGTSDQAFYVPAFVRAANPAAFPHDAPLIEAQARLMVLDEALGAILRTTGVSLEILSLVGYLLSLALIWVALLLIGRRLYTNQLATIALAAAFTLRHQISRTSANSFEPYFHPRMLAFGVGMLAVAGLLRRRPWLAAALVGASAVLHVTTGLWFAVLIGAALIVVDPRARHLARVAVPIALVLAVWALAFGPLRDRLATMDGRWMEAVASKDTLFATGWPLWAWAANLALLGFLWWAVRVRRRRGQAMPEEVALAWGATVLVGIFLLTLPAVAWHQALAVQLQISRVFWLVDFTATLIVIGALIDVPEGRRTIAMVLTTVLIVFSATRGAYIMFVERPERPLFAVYLPDSSWEDAMAWLNHRPLDVNVLADPGHAWKYGTSARVSAERDVFLEEVKDAALAMYSRDIAQRVVERTQAIGDFAAMTPQHARDLAARYDLDYLITETDLALPVAYRNAQFRIYELRTRP